MDVEFSYRESWPGVPASVPRARTWVTGHLETHLLESLVHSAVLVVSELTTNCVLHAATSFTVTLIRTDGVVRLGVQDESPRHPSPAAAGELDTGGRGLVLVEAFSSDWGVDADADGGKSVWAEFRVR